MMVCAPGAAATYPFSLRSTVYRSTGSPRCKRCAGEVRTALLPGVRGIPLHRRCRLELGACITVPNPIGEVDGAAAHRIALAAAAALLIRGLGEEAHAMRYGRSVTTHRRRGARSAW
jgi:hypothetical protein